MCSVKPRSFPVLLVGSAQRHSLEKMYMRAFQNNDFHDVDLLDIEKDRPAWARSKRVNRIFPEIRCAGAGQRLLSYLRDRNDHYRWIVVFKGMQFNRKVLEECRELAPNALWLNINPDDPYNLASRGASNKNVIESLSFFDVYCIWSRIIADKLRADGCDKVIYLPFGYDEIHNVLQDSTYQAHPEVVSFIGSWDKEREAILTQLQGVNLSIHGNRWERTAHAFPYRSRLSYCDVFGPEMATIIASSAISLNLLRQQNRGSHNMRTFEIPAMGGLMLTNRTAEQQDIFPEGEACYMYADIFELKEKIEYILANKKAADRVRARGQELAKTHSYSSRVGNLLRHMSG